jgi:hypothetical protein
MADSSENLSFLLGFISFVPDNVSGELIGTSRNMRHMNCVCVCVCGGLAVIPPAHAVDVAQFGQNAGSGCRIMRCSQQRH